MANFLYKTKDNANPKGKPRVYFTCHPEDFAQYFERICEDIFKTHDCAIYYTENMIGEIDDQEKSTDLGRMNLFVVPITFKLLAKPNRAMDLDLAYAKQENIPILPFMMEFGIDDLYSSHSKFGNRQYINPYSVDITEIKYGDKLKKYLDSVLIRNEIAEKIRATFNAYIFLSYRKKDRHYANKLMQLIHSIPECRDIAIWYDEFLTLGEDFQQNIEKALKKSELFTLLVTPNLLEYVDGKPNYVMAHEYPKAKKAKIKILPAEMKKTNKEDLRSKYEGIPDCVNPVESVILFKEFLVSVFPKSAISENKDNPARDFLIGLAYLDGIDVEVNRKRGIGLITAAAEAGLIEAMEKCYSICKIGGDQVNFKNAKNWAEKIVQYKCLHYGEENDSTISAMAELASIYCLMYSNCNGPRQLVERKNNYRKAVDIRKRIFSIQHKTVGKYHYDTLLTLRELGMTYLGLGEPEKALSLFKVVYFHQNNVLGDDNSVTIDTMKCISLAYDALGFNQKSIEIMEKVYQLQCKTKGEDQIETIDTLGKLALLLSMKCENERALTLTQKVYELYCKTIGSKSWKTLLSLRDVAESYEKLSKFDKAKEYFDLFYALCCSAMEENDPRMIYAIEYLADKYYDIGDIKKSIKMQESLYSIRRRLLGEDDPDTIQALEDLAGSYANEKIKNYQKSMELFERSYALHYKIYGKESLETALKLQFIKSSYKYLIDAKIDLFADIDYVKKIYNVRCEILGDKHDKTIEIKTLIDILVNV